MTVHKSIFQTVSGCIMLAAVANAPVHAALPENTYACHVETVSAGPGFVSVQAETMQDARRIAGSWKKAVTMRGTRAPARKVVECVEAPKGRFSDAAFQEFYEQLDR